MKELYTTALVNLNNRVLGDSLFQQISIKLANLLFPDYNFIYASGGDGPRDAGRDGYSQEKEAVLACSINSQSKRKIIADVEKNIGYAKEIFCFTNQRIKEEDRKTLISQFEDKISLKIYALEDIVQKIELYREKYEAKKIIQEILDLLDVGTLLRPYVIDELKIQKEQLDSYPDQVFESELLLIEKESTTQFIGQNPLFDYVSSLIKQEQPMPNIIVKGKFHVGKTFIMIDTFNRLLETKKQQANSPIPVFYRLRFNSQIDSKQYSLYAYSKFIFFLDGFDELSEKEKVNLSKSIASLSKYNNVSFVVSGRDASFSSDLYFLQQEKCVLTRLLTHLEPNERALLSKNHSASISQVLELPAFRSLINKENKIDYKSLYELLLVNEIQRDLNKANQSNGETYTSSFLDINSIRRDIFPILSNLCHTAYIEKKDSFSINELKDAFHHNPKFIHFITNSILLTSKENNYVMSEAFYTEFFFSSLLHIS